MRQHWGSGDLAKPSSYWQTGSSAHSSPMNKVISAFLVLSGDLFCNVWHLLTKLLHAAVLLLAPPQYISLQLCTHWSCTANAWFPITSGSEYCYCVVHTHPHRLLCFVYLNIITIIIIITTIYSYLFSFLESCFMSLDTVPHFFQQKSSSNKHYFKKRYFWIFV